MAVTNGPFDPVTRNSGLGTDHKYVHIFRIKYYVLVVKNVMMVRNFKAACSKFNVGKSRMSVTIHSRSANTSTNCSNCP